MILQSTLSRYFKYKEPSCNGLQLLLLRGYAFNASADFETIRLMKEKLCYVAYDVETEQKLANETTVLVEQYEVGFTNNAFTIYFLLSGPFAFKSIMVQLPDGRVIRVGGERFGASEALFQPHLINVEGVGVAELLFNTINVRLLFHIIIILFILFYFIINYFPPDDLMCRPPTSIPARSSTSTLCCPVAPPCTPVFRRVLSARSASCTSSVFLRCVSLPVSINLCLLLL